MTALACVIGVSRVVVDDDRDHDADRQRVEPSVTISDRPMRPLLTVKQLIPPVRPGAVSRPELERRLRGADTGLTIVVAPAGWGKTTLLAAFVLPAVSRMLATDARLPLAPFVMAALFAMILRRGTTVSFNQTFTPDGAAQAA